MVGNRWQRTAEARFWEKVNKTETCWLWMATFGRGGYGRFKLDGKHVPAHRWAYEDANGPIPEALTIDHLCRVRNCVNPAHLEAVTVRVNTLRGNGPPAVNARKTRCHRGHPLDGRTGRGYRYCKTCAAAAQRRYRLRKKSREVQTRA